MFGAVNTSGSCGRKQLRRHLPRAARRLHQRDARRAGHLPAHEHHRRRHVHVGVRRVDAEIGAVGAIAEHLVGDDDGAAVPGDVPLVQVGPGRPRARVPVPSVIVTSKTFFANSCSAYRPGDVRLMRISAVPSGKPVKRASTCIQRCSGVGNDSRYSNGAGWARADDAAARHSASKATVAARGRHGEGCVSCVKPTFPASRTHGGPGPGAAHRRPHPSRA